MMCDFKTVYFTNLYSITDTYDSGMFVSNVFTFVFLEHDTSLKLVNIFTSLKLMTLEFYTEWHCMFYSICILHGHEREYDFHFKIHLRKLCCVCLSSFVNFNTYTTFQNTIELYCMFQDDIHNYMSISFPGMRLNIFQLFILTYHIYFTS